MEQLQCLVRKREGYLSYFYKVIRKLTSLNERIVKEQGCIETEKERQEEAIKTAESKIQDGQKGIIFLDEQTKINEAQIAKIRDIVEPASPKKKESK